MTRFVDAGTLKDWLHDGAEIALFDVRESGQYGEAHLFFAMPLPYSRLELEVARLAPRKSVRLVVYDAGHSVAIPAAVRLAQLGYTEVHVLRGGTAGWKAAGHALFAGVNLPSKTFGELAEHAYATPRISALELAAMQARGEDVIVLDGRPYSEYRKMNIPGAICCPNGELGYRLHDLVARDSTTIVINCAGRTRSIVGAQTLINLGIPNPVYALENGTQGWYLNDLKLEHGSTRRYPQDLAHGRLEQMQAAAQRLAHRFDVPLVEPATVERWAKDEQRTLFLCDVRTPEEFARGSLGGAQHTPGGQLIQATDQYIGVRHARLVLFDSDGIRATIVASWLRQMGHDASVLKGGLASGLALEQPQPPGLAALPSVTVEQLARGLAVGEIAAIDLRPSMQYRLAHVPGSAWSIRPRLAAQLATEHRHLVLIDDDPRISQAAATGLADMPLASVSRLEGGFDAWRAAGLEVVASPNSPPDALCIDYLFFVHDRHDGNKAAARQYLAWETNLVSQLDQLELDSFTFDFPHHNKETTNAG